MSINMRKLILIIFAVGCHFAMIAQAPTKIYDETLDPDLQIQEAVAKASAEGKHVLAQLGGNWCKWCVRFARYVMADEDLRCLVDDNYEYIHVNYNPRSATVAADQTSTIRALQRLGNPTRFGYPVLVVLDENGNVIHTQDSALLESGDGYDKEKVKRFFEMWTPTAIHSAMTEFDVK